MRKEKIITFFDILRDVPYLYFVFPLFLLVLYTKNRALSLIFFAVIGIILPLIEVRLPQKIINKIFSKKFEEVSIK